MSDIGIYHQKFDQRYRSGIGIERPAGYYLTEGSESTFGIIDTSRLRFDTADEARAAFPQAEEILAKRAEAKAARLAAQAERDAQEKAAQAAQAKRSEYREVDSPLYGRGRRYRSQPGATQYDNGSGRYSVQIWDES